MLLAIISDTHLPRGERTIPARCLERCRRADAIVHAGDLIDVAVLDLLRSLGPPVHAVAGNCDTPALLAALPHHLELGFEQTRIGMIHDAGRASGRLQRLASAFPGVDAVIFGHTHSPQHEQTGGLQIFNPGSPTERRRAPTHTMGLARIDGRAISFEHVTVG